ncbi:MAG TPA: PaaI family thioesterase [Gemmatales bacterium]|nr:PaaI family thioesterase [Gemmatales bacterium]HMP17619.1 PaaI family thioesterase [Gemmatales bacterium]
MSMLEQWLAQEEAQRQRTSHGPGPGILDPAIVKQLTGMELIQGILNGTLPHAALAKTLDFLMLEAEPGRTLFQGAPSEKHLNPMGVIHGGWFASILDSALGCAIITRMEPGQAFTTVELSVNIVRALSPAIQRVRAEAQVLHCGRQLATAEARLTGPDGKLYAHATTTCLVYKVP